MNHKYTRRKKSALDREKILKRDEDYVISSLVLLKYEEWLEEWQDMERDSKRGQEAFDLWEEESYSHVLRRGDRVVVLEIWFWWLPGSWNLEGQDSRKGGRET